MTISTSGKVGRFQTVWTGVAGAPYYTTWWAKVTDSIPDGFVDAVKDTLADFAGMWPNELSWTTGGVSQVIDIASGLVVDVTTVESDGGLGESSERMLPSRTQIVAGLRTGEYAFGREVRGRVFLPAPARDQINDDGTFLEATRTALESRIQDMYDDTLGFNGAGSIYSRTHHLAANISTVQVNRSFGSLRTR